MHYSRFKRWGDVGPPHQLRGGDPLPRSLSQVQVQPNGCWTGVGQPSGRDGYRSVRTDGRDIKAHRLMYEFLVGPIPDGLTLDHLCRNTACCNPDHLEPVTQRVNNLRSRNVSGINAAKTHCKRGHEFTDENTKWSFNEWGNPRRHCRACTAESKRRHYLARKGSR